MIDEDFRFADPRQDPRNKPHTETPGLVEQLEAQGFRPFGEEW